MKLQFGSIAEFLNMDGYAGYVFSAFLIAVFVFIVLLIRGTIKSRQAIARLKSLEAIKEAAKIEKN